MNEPADRLDTVEPSPAFRHLAVWKVGVFLAVAWVLFAAYQSGLIRSEVCGIRQTPAKLMRQWGMVFAMYANESGTGDWPPMSDIPGVWAPDLESLYLEFISKPDQLVSPGHADGKRLRAAAEMALSPEMKDLRFAAKVMGQSFAYTGYLMRDVDEFRAVVAHRSAVEAGATVSEKTEVYPLRDDVELHMIKEVFGPNDPRPGLRSRIPVLIEVSGWQSDSAKPEGGFKGANVLYLDGHVEFVPLGTFPVVPEVMDVLAGE